MNKQLIVLALMMASSAAALANDFLKALPPVSTIIDGYADPDSVMLRLDSQPLAPEEGLWQMLDGGATFTIERHVDRTLPAGSQPAGYRLIMVKAPDRLIRPGTVIGHAVATTQDGVFEASLYTDYALNMALSIPRHFTLHLSSDGATVTFKPSKSKLVVNWFRLLPYMYRHVIRLRDNRPDNLDGAVKVYPPVVTPRFGPRYL